MARTTVIIRQLSGPHLDPDINYQVWTPSSRIFEDGTVTEAGPGRVDLVDGAGSVQVAPGVWFVDAVLPGGPHRRAVRVPASTTAVFYDKLPDVTDQTELGYGPTWSAQAMLAANEARVSADKAAVSQAESLKALAEGRTLRDQIKKLLETVVAPPADTIDAGPAGDAIRLLDDADPQKWILASAADSTWDQADEIFEGAWKASSALWPERSWVLRRFNKETDEHAAQVVWRTAPNGRPATAIVAASGTGTGAVTTTTKKTVFSDNFNRAADDLVGTLPQTGGVWKGKAGLYGLTLIGSQGVVEGLTGRTITDPIHAGVLTHDGSRDGEWFTVTRLTTKSAGITAIYGPYVSETDSGLFLRIDTGTTADTHKLDLVSRVAGEERVVASLDGTALAAATSDQFSDIKISIVGRTATVRMETTIPALAAREVSGEITAREVAAWEDYDEVRAVSTNARFRLDYFQASAITVTTTAGGGTPEAVDPGVGLQAAVYNGAIAGSKIDSQLDRLRKLYPVRPNLLLIGHGLNYADATPAEFLADIQRFVDAFLALYPGVAIGIVTQNPRYYQAGYSWPESRVADHAARQAAIKGYATKQGWWFVDTFSAFVAAPSGGVYLVDPTDGTHPIEGGKALQVGILRAAISAISLRGTGGSTPGGGTPIGGGGLQLEFVPGRPGLLRIKS
ncbi:SGNH/GDSL hydrolase family protein [Clavibacter michiganensis subsp. michiganensis]|uniref:SGNH/GDSL hydrolase family protein n=1 Tax=Clavibacter michiganensis TaxID=28447 RepID=UPI001C6514BA|nr:SGNH/GDSL hydrolase family protein [Clavibacter michiganensis]MBW8025282.1 SGNH/GDSL hydrolase family protein [Clavibacter michiganensis subsp. michiganensis]